MSLTISTVTIVSCGFCGYRRTLSPSEAINWQKGERYSGSQDCPACSCGGGSAASWGKDSRTDTPWIATVQPGVMT